MNSANRQINLLAAICTKRELIYREYAIYKMIDAFLQNLVRNSYISVVKLSSNVLS